MKRIPLWLILSTIFLVPFIVWVIVTWPAVGIHPAARSEVVTLDCGDVYQGRDVKVMVVCDDDTANHITEINDRAAKQAEEAQWARMTDGKPG